MNPIVGIGELLWDIYPDGRKAAGGAPFNFAFHCHQLGHPAVVVSRVGDDDLGRELRDRVISLGLSDEFIQTDHDHPTGTVRVTLDGGGVPTYEIVENVAWDYLQWDDGLARLAETCRAVCFGSLAQRLGTPPAIHKLVTIARERKQPGLIVFDVNLRGLFFHPASLQWGLEISHWRKVNSDELGILAAMFDWKGKAEIDDLKSTFDWPSRNGVAILTRGEGGCAVFHQWEEDDGEGGETFPSETLTEPAAPARVLDTVGAGDAFTAAMVCLHLEGRPLRDCARFASHYAARVCEHQGATPRIDRAGVERAAFGPP